MALAVADRVEERQVDAAAGSELRVHSREGRGLLVVVPIVRVDARDQRRRTGRFGALRKLL